MNRPMTYRERALTILNDMTSAQQDKHVRVMGDLDAEPVHAAVAYTEKDDPLGDGYPVITEL